MAFLQLHTHHLAAGATIDAGADRGAVHVVEGAATVGGRPVAAGETAFLPGGAIGAADDALLLVWTLVTAPAADATLAGPADLDGPRLLRADRVDFPPGGVAYLHTHQGPGVRVLVEGRFAVETGGSRQSIERLGAWYEAGPEPVYAEVVGDGPAAFVRVMVLPASLLGQSSIRYVSDEDRERPKSQRYTVSVDEPLDG